MTGTGTVTDPYIITTVDDLQAIENDLDAYYELSGDIDATATSGWNSGEGFVPISYFEGRLDGKGFTITGLFINESTKDGGLFDTIEGTVTAISVTNLTLASVDITGKDVAALCDNNYGGVVGDVPNIVNVHSSGSVTGTGTYGAAGLVVDNQSVGSTPDIGGYIHQCSSSCTVSSTGTYAGGLVAVQGCFMTQSFATGNVTGGAGTFEKAGGCIGRQVSVSVTTITRDCYARGNVAAYWVGGFTADADGITDNCYSTGTVTASGSSAPNEGGFCRSNTGTMTDCFWDTETSGQATSDGGTGKTTAQMKTEPTFTGAGWNFATIWHMDGVTNNAFPFLGQGVIVHPVDNVARVSSIRHIWQPSKFVMQAGLGDLGFDIDVAEATVRSALDTAREIEEPPAEPLVEKPTAAEPTDEGIKAPEPIELTQYAKDILQKPAAKALAARIAGLRQGVEAVVTPYAIDVLMQKEKEATKLIELQRIQKSASATGISGYARDILEKRALALQRELEALYRSRR